MKQTGIENRIPHSMATSLLASLFIAFSLLLISTTHATSFNESCAKGDAQCPALLAYRLTGANPRSLQAISALFSVDPSQILSANGFSPRSPPNTTLFHDEIIKIPVPCSCVNNVRRGDSVVYTVVQDDFLSKIAQVTYGGLVTYQEIGAANSIQDLDKIQVGQQLVIPYPCSCHGNMFKGSPAFYLSYVVQPGASISAFSREFGVGVKDLQSLNSLNGTELEANVAIQIPVPACRANFRRGADDSNLTVAAGAYATTANGCVQCSCGSQNGTELYCMKAPSASSSCALKCNSSSLEIGSFSKKTSSNGCTIDSCLYDGYTSKTIFTDLQKNTTASQCPAVEAPPTYAYAPEEQGVPEALGGGNAPSPTAGSDGTPGTGAGPGGTSTTTSAPPPASSAQGLHTSSAIALITVPFVFLL